MIKLSDELYIPPMGQVLSERKAKRRINRHYAAARVRRTNADWTTQPTGANWTLYQDLRSLRARAREMVRNAPHFRKFMRMAERNVVGHAGIQLQCNATLGTSNTIRPNTKLNTAVETAFWEWSFPENCTLSGKLSFTAAQKMLVRHLIRDGEALIQHIDADNAHGYALKFWNVDWLDESYNETLPSGNRVIMSVEFDADDRPVAYWLTMPTNEGNFSRDRYRSRLPKRIPAEQMTHIMLCDEDETQARGVTWFHAALLQGKHLHEYTNHVVEQARVGAASLGFLEKEASDDTEFTGAENDEGEAAVPTIDVAPLSMNELPAGYKLSQFDPKQPAQNHAEFKNDMRLDLAAAMDVNGFSLSGDMSAVNYSSARVGLGEERDLWRELQTVVTGFCRDVYHRWLRSAMLSGRLDLSARDYEQLQNPNWKPRGWRYVDPHKEIQANIAAIEGNLATYRSTLAEQGVDLEEFLAEKQAEKELFAQYGVDYAPQPDKPAAANGEIIDEDDEPPVAKKSRGFAVNGNGHFKP